MSVCQKHQESTGDVQVVEGYKCQRCHYEYTWDEAGNKTNPRWPSDPMEDDACCPNCGKLTDDFDAADIEIETD